MSIRRGKITREDALQLAKTHDGIFPSTYLGKSLSDILEPIDINISEFEEICDRFTNKKLFKKNDDGSLKKDDSGRPIKINYDNL
jgi:hypothetical protein